METMQPRREARFAFVLLTWGRLPASLSTNMLREATMLRRFILAAACLLLSVQLGIGRREDEGQDFDLARLSGDARRLQARAGRVQEEVSERRRRNPHLRAARVRGEARGVGAGRQRPRHPRAARLHLPALLRGRRRSPTCRPISRRRQQQGDHRHAVPGHRDARRQALGPAVVVRPQRPVLQPRSSAGGRARAARRRATRRSGNMPRS